MGGPPLWKAVEIHRPCQRPIPGPQAPCHVIEPKRELRCPPFSDVTFGSCQPTTLYVLHLCFCNSSEISPSQHFAWIENVKLLIAFLRCGFCTDFSNFFTFEEKQSSKVYVSMLKKKPPPLNGQSKLMWVPLPLVWLSWPSENELKTKHNKKLHWQTVCSTP